MGQHLSKSEFIAAAATKLPEIFDRAHFESATMHDLVLQREILGLFFAQLEKVRERINAGPVLEADAKFLAHTLRGAAAAIGAVELEKIGTKWEKQHPNYVDLKFMIAAAEGRLRASIQNYLG